MKEAFRELMRGFVLVSKFIVPGFILTYTTMTIVEEGNLRSVAQDVISLARYYMFLNLGF